MDLGGYTRLTESHSSCCLGSGLFLALCLYLLAVTGLTSSVRPPASSSKDFTFTLSLSVSQNRPDRRIVLIH